MKKLNYISIALLCVGGFFKHNSYPFTNVLGGNENPKTKEDIFN
jgi:hypothetical protein